MTVANSGASLSAATSTGPGTAVTFTSVCKTHGHAVAITGLTGTGAVRVNLELSLDNSNWFVPAHGGRLVANANGVYFMRTTEDYPALYARGNLAEIDSGVSAVSVTSTIASE